MTALLVALGIGAIVVAVSVAVGGRRSGPTAAKWSEWQPPDSGTLGARDIADFVAPFYRIDSVNQLAVVTVVNLESAAAAAAAQQAAASGTTSNATGSGLQVAVRPSPTSSQVSLLSGNTIAYNLCGIGGKDCAIGVGQPSTNRLLLLRREALELALYTFRYIGGTQNVVAILPPGHTADVGHAEQEAAELLRTATTKPVDIAVLFVRQELSPLLKQPLAADPARADAAVGGRDGPRARGRARGSAHRARPVLRAAPAGSGRIEPDRPQSASASVARS